MRDGRVEGSICGMTIQFSNGMAIGRTLMTDGDVQIYAVKLDDGFKWSVTQGCRKVYESRMFARAVSVYHGLAKKEA